jgi:3-phytase
MAHCSGKKNNQAANGLEADSVAMVKATIISEKVLNDTDDPAIWINFDDPSKSLILGTDKGDSTGGIYVFDLEGRIDSSRSVFNLLRPNNIDIEYGLSIKGRKTDIAVFTERGRNSIRVFSLPEMECLDNGGIEVFVGDTLREPMGIGLYKDPGTGEIYAIVSRKTGPDGSYLWQYHLTADKKGIVSGKKVREFGRFSGLKEIEAIAVDDVLGHVYCSDEGFGIRQYHAHPDSSNIELAVFGTTGFSKDQEGISIYPTGDTTGYIIVSDQQANQFQIFTREGTAENPYDHRWIKTVKVCADESDGSEVTCLPLNETFKHGLFVVMSTDQTFRFYKWEDIAGDDLKVRH